MTAPTPMKHVRVQLDVISGPDGSAVWLPALTTGERWNGWAVPFFEKKTADQLVSLFEARLAKQGRGTRAWYEAKEDRYCFEDEDGEKEEFGSVRMADAVLYPIGASSWTWSAEGDFDGKAPTAPLKSKQ